MARFRLHAGFGGLDQRAYPEPILIFYIQSRLKFIHLFHLALAVSLRLIGMRRRTCQNYLQSMIGNEDERACKGLFVGMLAEYRSPS